MKRIRTGQDILIEILDACTMVHVRRDINIRSIDDGLNCSVPLLNTEYAIFISGTQIIIIDR